MGFIVKTKFCSKCKKEKLLSQFHNHKYHNDGLTSHCKDCLNIKSALYREKFKWETILGNIKQRCENLNNPAYYRYGGRGIKCLITVKQLKELWNRDKAYLLEIPTVDRINNNGDYTFENCQFIEKSINSSKDKFKPILQFDLEGNFIREWNSGKEIEEYFGIKAGNVSNCCYKKRRTAGGFIWRFKND